MTIKNVEHQIEIDYDTLCDIIQEYIEDLLEDEGSYGSVVSNVNLSVELDDDDDEANDIFTVSFETTEWATPIPETVFSPTPMKEVPEEDRKNLETWLNTIPNSPIKFKHEE